MNEELQSTAEELETGKEELQSMNEELITVNQELKTKIEELGRAYSDLQNLMAATQIATVFLDRNLRIKRYTPRAAELFHVIPSDVGRPFEHVTHRLDAVDVPALARRVLDTLVPAEQEVCDHDRGWHLLRVFPYRTVEDQIDGVVVTLVEVTALKEAEDELAARVEQQAAVAALGQRAISGIPLDALFDEACRLVADVLGDDYCKVLELTRDGADLLLRAGTGWKEGYVGTATVPNDTRSQAGYTLQATDPVLVEDVAEEQRFTAPTLLTEHDVVSGMSAPLSGPDGPWGVLGTHHTERRTFVEDDARFLQAIAHVLSEAIRRDATEAALRQSEAENREHLQEIEAIYETAPVGMAFLDPELRYRRINKRLADINGKPVEEHLGQPVREVLPQLADKLEPLLQKIMETGEGVHDVELHGHTAAFPDEERVWLTSYVPVYDEAGEIEGLNAVVRDITDRKRTEEALARSRDALSQEQARLEAILQQLPVGVIIADAPDARLLFTNDAARRLVEGVSLWGEHGDAFDRWIPHRHDGTPYPEDELPMVRVVRDGEVIEGEENLFRRPDGSWLRLRLYAGPVRDTEGTIIAGVVAFEDVTSQQETLEALASLTETLEERVSERTEQVRALSSALSMAEQHERARLAQVLHDDLQQVLYGLRLRLREHLEAGGTGRATAAPPAGGEGDTEGLLYADSLLDQALRITRTLTLDLKPPVLSAEGFETSLSWLAQHMYETYGLDVGVNVQSPVQLSDRHLHVLLFQLVRELLFNVVKHAEVEEAEVTVGIEDATGGAARLRVAVEDQGRGFDASAFAAEAVDARRSGFGLYSVKERLALLGGHMDITSSPGTGTRVLLTLPLDGLSSPDSSPTADL